MIFTKNVIKSYIATLRYHCFLLIVLYFYFCSNTVLIYLISYLFICLKTENFCIIQLYNLVARKETSSLQFALAWDNPKLKFRDGTVIHTRRYARQFGTHGKISYIFFPLSSRRYSVKSIHLYLNG